MKALKLVASLATLLVCNLGHAAVFNFADLTYDGHANHGFLPTNGIVCTGGDLCSSNIDGGVLGGKLTFVSGGLTVNAVGSYNGQTATAMQDHENAYNPATLVGAGLGVYHVAHDNSDDNIQVGETLTLTFNQTVEITNIGLRADGHNASGWTNGATFLLDGVSTALPKNVGAINGLTLVGTQFTFAAGGRVPDQFYLASITAQAVPEPESLALVAIGAAGLLLASRRRSK